MKKIFFTIFIFMMLLLPVNAKTLKGSVSLDWDKLTQTEITDDILNVKEMIFSGKEISLKNKKEFKQEIKPYKKDTERTENYIAARLGGGDFSDRIVVPFYYKKILYAYGIIYKGDLKTCYYYTPFGRLFTVEYLENDYGNYPIISYQYKNNGEFIAAVYNTNADDQYMYKKDGTFIGRWFKENYYDEHGKIVMTRNLPMN